VARPERNAGPFSQRGACLSLDASKRSRPPRERWQTRYSYFVDSANVHARRPHPRGGHSLQATTLGWMWPLRRRPWLGTLVGLVAVIGVLTPFALIDLQARSVDDFVCTERLNRATEPSALSVG
jgi:hypothetical protein